MKHRAAEPCFEFIEAMHRMRRIGRRRDAEHVVFRAARRTRNLHRLELQCVRRHQVAFP